MYSLSKPLTIQTFLNLIAGMHIMQIKTGFRRISGFKKNHYFEVAISTKVSACNSENVKKNSYSISIFLNSKMIFLNCMDVILIWYHKKKQFLKLLIKMYFHSVNRRSRENSEKRIFRLIVNCSLLITIQLFRRGAPFGLSSDSCQWEILFYYCNRFIIDWSPLFHH